MRTWTDAHDPRLSRTVGLGLGLLAIAVLLLVAIFALGGKAGANVPNTNEVAYWCPNGGVKYDNLTSSSFTVPAPPDGKTWSLLVLKAGSDQSVENENETFPNPVVGQSYSHSSGKTLSHAILCYGPPVTTTTGATTTGASTTLATTTTGATTTGGTTTVVVTNPQTVPTTTIATTTTFCDEDECTTTTAPTTTAATTTVPRTTTTAATTTAATTTGPPCDVAHSCISIPVTTASTIATTTTVAPPTTIPDTTAVDQTLPPAPAAPVTPAPTTLPVTGGSPWWLALFGVCLVGLGGLLVAWRRS